MPLVVMGSCSSPVFSICWTLNDDTSFDRPSITLWLDGTELTSIGRQGKFMSLSVTSSRMHTLKAEVDGNSKEWNFSVISGSNSINISSTLQTYNQPVDSTVEVLQSFMPNKVFACENNTLYLHQVEGFILALGSTQRTPLRLESRSDSTLLVSWREDPPLPPDPLHRVSLYRQELDAAVAHGHDTTQSSHYRFSALESCRRYIACVEIASSPAIVCLGALTDPGVPTDVRVTAWNSSSVTVAWDCPLNLSPSSFLITIFHLNGSGHIVDERPFRHKLDDLVFTVSDLPPCSKLKLGLQAVCESEGQLQNSRMVHSNGNSANSEIESLHQSSSGWGSYTVSWSVRNTSSISSFRVYHEGELKNSTLFTSYSVTGLLPCHQYTTRVEAVCGASTVMSMRTVHTRAGPGEVSELHFQQQDLVASWNSESVPHATFLYRLANVTGSDIQTGRVTDTTLPLPNLEPGVLYELEIREECEGGERGSPTVLCFVRDEAPSPTPLPIVDPPLDGMEEDLGFQFDFQLLDLAIVVPWMLPSPLDSTTAQLQDVLEETVRKKLKDLLRDYPREAEVHLVAFEEFKNRTKITFEAFDVSSKDFIENLFPEELLDYIRTLNHSQITIEDDVIYWDDPDECASPDQNKCGSNSFCINTLDSYTCVCRHGYYDVSHFLGPSVHFACHEKGLFTECKKGGVAGGVSKHFLTNHLGGNVSVTLNDGRCTVNETETFYYYRMNVYPPQCGVRRQMNQTHVEFRNTLTVVLSSERTITRRDLRVEWKCTYPRLYTHGAHVKADLDWFNSHTVVEYNSTLLLKVGMALYSDESFTYDYTDGVVLAPSDYLFLEVTLHAEDTLAYNMTLVVESCWATETTNPQEDRKAFFLKDGCPVDRTFHWYPSDSLNRSRFSVQTFTMSTEMPIYVHCLARICTREENCTTICPARKTDKVRRDLQKKLAAIVSAGPVSILHKRGTSGEELSHRNEFFILIAVVGGSIGLLLLTGLGVRATKAAVKCWERRL